MKIISSCILVAMLSLVTGNLAAQNSLTATEGSPKLDGVASPGEWTSDSITTSVGLTIKAMIDETYLYVLATWSDATLSVGKGQLSFDGATWSSSGEEDRVGIIWDMGENGTDGASCATMCHPPSMSTNTGRVDVWHWKAVRSNPLGYVDDKWWDMAGRHGDSGSGIDSTNGLDGSGLPGSMATTDPDASVTYLAADQSALNLADPFGVLSGTFGLATAHDPTATFSAGATIPGRILTIPAGSRADVRAAGKHDNGVWTVEFRRLLIASDDDFDAVRGTSVDFATEIFDNVGDTHFLDGVDSTVFTLNIPSPKLYFSQFGNGSGLISEIVLSNPSESTAVTGTVEFLDDNGAPLAIGLASIESNLAPLDFQPAQVSTTPITIPARGTLTIATDGAGAIAVGSAIVTSTEALGGVVRFNLQGAGITGVGTSDPLTGFMAPVRSTSGGINTGVALQNPGDKEITLNLSLLDAQGQTVANGTSTIANFAGKGHQARFINELFPSADTQDFQGAIVVEVTGGLVAATALELGTQVGEFTTLPVKALP